MGAKNKISHFQVCRRISPTRTRFTEPGLRPGRGLDLRPQREVLAADRPFRRLGLKHGPPF